MVTVLKAEGSGGGGGTQALSANLRKTIQFIKEIVRNHSDTEIYHTLRESNMDPNETTQKLLNQDPFHEVKRKRDKRKENTGVLEPRRQIENPINPPRFNPAVRNVRNVRRGGFVRNNFPARTDTGVSREFRVVRDNRVSQTSDGDNQPASASSNPALVTKVLEKSAIRATNHRQTGGRYIPHNRNGMTDSQRVVNRGYHSNQHKEEYNKPKSTSSTSTAQPQTAKPGNAQSETPRPASSSSTVGVYASALDPVHVPSPDSRSPSVGAIQRDVGVVGIRKSSSQPSKTGSNTVQGRADSAGSVRPASTVQENGQPGKSTVNDNVVQNTNRALSGQHQRPHQQPAGHQKGNIASKEWKPKVSQKSNTSNPGVIGTPIKSSSHALDLKNQQSETDQLQEKLLQVDINGTQNVIIAQHIRVPKKDRCHLTFGSFGTELDSSTTSVSSPLVAGNDSAAVSTSETGAGSKLEDQVRTSSATPSDAGSDKESPNNGELDGYADVGIVRGNSPSLAVSESQHHHDPQELPNFSAYDPQTGYDMPYFRPAINDAIRGQNLPSQQEALASHSANSIPASSIAMLHQPPQMMAHMYPQQVHLSHFANVMPYRQYLSPVFIPPVGLPGYSNPASPYSHPHPSSGSGYVVMPGGSSQHHLAPNGSLKYGVQQFKTVPGGNTPAAFGNYGGAPAGYAMSAPLPGVMAGATGLEDSSRMKYKDNNLYVPNQQAETSEVWIQNPRDIPGMQSAPYYNMQGQAAHPAAAFMPSHAATGHTSFNPSQSSHMQFQGVYHAPPQPGPIANAHHLGGPVGGNVGIGVGPGTGAAQVGAYQQAPQLGHMNWTGNF